MNTSLISLLCILQDAKTSSSKEVSVSALDEIHCIRQDIGYLLDKEIHEAVSLYQEEYETWLDSLETQDQDKDEWINSSSVPFDGTIPF